MSIRENIAKCIRAGATDDEAARLICGYLYNAGLLEPGNGWLDDDPAMLESISDYYTKAVSVIRDADPFSLESGEMSVSFSDDDDDSDDDCDSDEDDDFADEDDDDDEEDDESRDYSQPPEGVPLPIPGDKEP